MIRKVLFIPLEEVKRHFASNERQDVKIVVPERLTQDLFCLLMKKGKKVKEEVPLQGNIWGHSKAKFANNNCESTDFDIFNESVDVRGSFTVSFANEFAEQDTHYHEEHLEIYYSECTIQTKYKMLNDQHYKTVMLKEGGVIIFGPEVVHKMSLSGMTCIIECPSILNDKVTIADDDSRNRINSTKHSKFQFNNDNKKSLTVNSSKELNGTRRQMLLAAASALVGSAATEITRTIIRAVKPLFYTKTDSSVTQNEYLNLIFPMESSIQLIPGSNHPLLIADNPSIETMDPLVHSLSYLKLIHPKAEGVPIPRPDLINEKCHLVCFGCPITNPYTKSLLGYHGSGMRIERSSKPILHYSLLQDEQRIFEISRRYKAGKIHEVPNWQIQSEYGAKRRFRPDLDEEGFLKSDYLLITKLRNPYDEKMFVVIVEGVHGTGTMAFKQVMDDHVLQNYASRQIQQIDCEFQSIFYVSGIKHDHIEGITTFNKVEHVDTVIL